MKQIVECVPNFSEGRDRKVIDAIAGVIKGAGGVTLLDVFSGFDTNRTVMTFVGEPRYVVEAAFLAVRKAAELIDMRRHHGVHPRIGATDVLPLVPVSGVTLEECAILARSLAKRVAEETGIPCYCYEAAALRPERKNLAVCRLGEYESLPVKLLDPDKAPDYGARPMDDIIARSGCTIVGARDILIAVNFNLNTVSTRIANAIAFDVREKGRPLRENNSLNGKIIRNGKGEVVWQPGTLKGTKAIGWFIPEYGIAQVSMNITDLNATPLHQAFEQVSRCARQRGVRVTGTEIIGLLPKRCLIEAARYYLHRQHRSTGIPEEDLIFIAVKSLGLSDLTPFDVRRRLLDPEPARKNEKVSVYDISRASGVPLGGGVAAFMGALAAALGTMIANRSAVKRGWEGRWKEFSDKADAGQLIIGELLSLSDEEKEAYDAIGAAVALPKKSESEIKARIENIRQSTLHAIEVALKIMRASMKTFPLCKELALTASISNVGDAGAAALTAYAAVIAAGINMKIGAVSVKDDKKTDSLLADADRIIVQATNAKEEIVNIVKSKVEF